MLNICKSTNLFERIIVKIPPFSYLYCSFYKRAVEQEASFADVSNTDKLLFIGGGAIPYTAILMAKKAQHVTVVDCDKKSANLATSLIKKLKLTNITIRCCQGELLNSIDHSIIFIPLQAEPKQQILKNIKTKCTNNTKILMRIPKNSFCNIYSTLESMNIIKYQEKKIKQLTYNKIVMFKPEDINYGNEKI